MTAVTFRPSIVMSVSGHLPFNLLSALLVAPTDRLFTVEAAHFPAADHVRSVPLDNSVRSVQTVYS